MFDRRTFLIKSAAIAILGNSFLNKSHSKNNDLSNEYNPIKKKY